MAVSALLTPHDDFPGRSTSRFGVGELIDLSFTSAPEATAAELGGLTWFIAEGAGTLTGTGGNDGQGLFTAPPSGRAVTLVLKVASGDNAGAVVASAAITIVEPEDAQMIQTPGTQLLHVNGTWSCGFHGQIFLLPADVSFTNILMREGSVPAVASGFLADMNGNLHETGPLASVGRGDSALGCKVNVPNTEGDQVFTGSRFPPFADGDFLWDIPWQYTVGGSPLKTFTTAQHHTTADANGQATISKKGAGPFSRAPSDPTNAF